MKKRNNVFTLLMLGLPTLMLILVSFYPLIRSLIMSFTNYNVLRPNQDVSFVGAENYSKFFDDTRSFPSLSFSLIYAFFCVSFSYIIGLGLALLMNAPIKFRAFFRALILLPWAIPTVVATANWLWILNDQVGFVNVVLQEIGLIDSPIMFIANPVMARITCIIVGTWKSYPFMALSLLAGLQSIPDELYESARMDGAGSFRCFWNITLPLLKNVSAVIITMMFIWGFNNFDIIYLLTQGGPLESTYTLPIYTYNIAFYRGQMGYASAVSMITLVILLAFCLVYMKVQKLED